MTGLLFLSERWRWFWFNERKGWTVLIAVAAVGAVLLTMLLWWLAALVFRWRLQFSIRSLLVLVVAVALPCSWVAVEMKKAREQAAAVEAIVGLGGIVEDHDLEVDANGRFVPPRQPSEPAWLRKVLGNRFFTEVVVVKLSKIQGTDVPLANIVGLSQLKRLSLDRTQLTDAGLEQLTRLPQLRELSLNNTQITDAGVAKLAGLPQFTTLSLDGTQVTDAGVANLAGLTRLCILSLYHTQVTDEGLEHLKGLTQLRRLVLGRTKVTDEGVAMLQEALPNCKIVHH